MWTGMINDFIAGNQRTKTMCRRSGILDTLSVSPKPVVKQNTSGRRKTLEGRAVFHSHEMCKLQHCFFVNYAADRVITYNKCCTLLFEETCATAQKRKIHIL